MTYLKKIGSSKITTQYTNIKKTFFPLLKTQLVSYRFKMNLTVSSFYDAELLERNENMNIIEVIFESNAKIVKHAALFVTFYCQSHIAERTITTWQRYKFFMMNLCFGRSQNYGQNIL